MIHRSLTGPVQASAGFQGRSFSVETVFLPLFFDLYKALSARVINASSDSSGRCRAMPIDTVIVPSGLAVLADFKVASLK